LVLTRFDYRYSLAAVNLAGVLTAGVEFLVARRLKAGYVHALEGGLRRQGVDLEQAAQYSLSDFTAAGSMAGLDRTAVLREHASEREKGSSANGAGVVRQGQKAKGK